ncbi:MAG TPA: hypothetical protein VI895_14465 [Bdellovibrionota bacterium]|nr:hypothetical protein [Bdellovibrionota bacterium]
MSLRSFHIFFISICGLLCLFIVGWTAFQSEATGSVTYAPFGFVGAAGLVGLVFYLRWFLRHHGRHV